MAQCEVCGNDVVQGRGRARRTCSAACRQKAHRRRQAKQVAELREAATRPALALVPPAAAPEVTAAEDSPAGRIRAAGAALAASIEHAAQRAADGWASRPGFDSNAETWASAVRIEASEVVAAILASMPGSSRDEPKPHPATARDTAETAGSSRNEPAAPAPVPVPVAPEAPAAVAGPSRDEPPVKKAGVARRKRLSQKAARAVADSAQLVKDPRYRENSRWNLVAEDGTVLGHVEPSYGGASRSGRNGWRYRDALTGLLSSGRPYNSRDGAALQCAMIWMQLATAPVRNTVTDD